MTSGKLVSTSGSLVTLMLAREVGLTLKALLLPLGSPSRPCAVPLLRLGVGCGAVPGGQLSVGMMTQREVPWSRPPHFPMVLLQQGPSSAGLRSVYSR